MNSGSDVGSISVALPVSVCSRQLNPGDASAIALTRARASKNGWTRGSPRDATNRPTLIWARCHSSSETIARVMPSAPVCLAGDDARSRRDDKMTCGPELRGGGHQRLKEAAQFGEIVGDRVGALGHGRRSITPCDE